MKKGLLDSRESINANKLSILQHGRCTICNKHLISGTKVVSGVLADGSIAIACEDCRGSIDKTIKEYVYYPHETKIPDKDTKLWRYQDFAKFVSLLDSHRLFFTRADAFDDPFEGARGFHFQKDAIYAEMKTFLSMKVRTRLGSTSSTPITDDIIEAELNNEMELFIKEQEKKRKDYFVSCWHSNERESEGMWKLYTTAMNQGVCIQTTVEKLCNSIQYDGFRLAEVKYVSFDEPLKENMTPIWYKRDAFEHENEVRVVIKDTDCKETGLPIEVDLNTLIDNIYVSPTAPSWLADLVKSVIMKYGVDKPVVYSQLNESPVY